MAASETFHLTIHKPPLRGKNVIYTILGCTTVYIQELNVTVMYNVLRDCVVTITVSVSHRGSFSASVRDGGAVKESHRRVDHVGVHQEHNPPQPVML